MLHKLTVTSINIKIPKKKAVNAQLRQLTLPESTLHSCNSDANMDVNVTPKCCQTFKAHKLLDLNDLNDLKGLKSCYERRLLRKTVNAFTQRSTMTPNNNINEKEKKATCT
jgi:hypothetical protein